MDEVKGAPLPRKRAGAATGGAKAEPDVRASGAGNDRILGRPYGRVQVIATGRKLFGRERQRVFLEHLAATCNVRRSARAAGVTAECVYARRMRDAGFRALWQQALEQGYARLEARLLEAAAGGGEAVEVDGDLVLPEEPLDKDLALHLLREHKKGLAGISRGGAAPAQGADWAEVEAYFIARLKALKVRIDPPSPEASAEVPAGAAAEGER